MARPRPVDDAGALAGEARGGEAAPGGSEGGEPVARLAANQLKRMRRIVDAAVELAEGGGFEAVRLRDVAERSDVALGTLYKYFRSKEDILLFALNEEATRLESALVERPLRGDTPFARATELFRISTRALVRRAALSRAMIRALTGSDQELAVKVAAFKMRIARLIAAALRGETPDLATPLDASIGSERERAVAQTIMHVWFSSLVGWSAGLHRERSVVEQVRTAAELLLGGERH